MTCCGEKKDLVTCCGEKRDLAGEAGIGLLARDQRGNRSRGTDPDWALAMTLRLAALRMSLSKVLTIWENLGLRFRSRTQQSSMSWCRAVGQSIGGGSR